MYSRIKTGFSIALAHTVYALSHLIPRDKNTWIFIGWHRNAERQIFADNAKYMFLHTHHNTDTRAVWIAEDQKLANILTEKGYESYTRTSLRGTYYSLRAGITVLDAYFHRTNWQYSGGSTILQLWHGKGFKKSGKVRHSISSRILSPELYTQYDYTIASSPYTAKMMAEIFKLSESRVLITGLPRTDILKDNIPGAEIDAHPQLKELSQEKNNWNTVHLYAPTFRRWQNDILSHLDLEKLQKYLAEKNELLILSLHPKNHSKTLDVERFSNIRFIEGSYDIYPYLHIFDTLVTDYSGLFIEFVFLNKHTIFFTYDLEQYKRDAGLYEDYESLTPGPKAKDTDELILALSESKKWEAEREKVCSMLFTHPDSKAAARIAEIMLEQD